MSLYSEPSFAVKRAMTWLLPISGCGGILHYDWRAQFVQSENRTAHTVLMANASTVARRLDEMRAIGQELRPHLDLLATGEWRELNVSKYVHAAWFAPAIGGQAATGLDSSVSGWMFIVNSRGIAIRNWTVVVASGGGHCTISRLLEPWAVAKVDLRSECTKSTNSTRPAHKSDDTISLPAATDKLDDQRAQQKPTVVTALPNLLSIDWQRLPDLVDAQGRMGSGGFQNSGGGWVTGTQVITAFGHGPNRVPVNQSLSSAYLLNATAALASPCLGGHAGGQACPGWERLPDAPVVSGRSDLSSATIDGSLYVIGGFNAYTKPKCFADFLRLSPPPAHGANGTWAWCQLTPFPYPLTMHAAASVGTKLYVFGGACFDGKTFYTFSDCSGGTPGLGKRLHVFDVAAPQLGWTRLPDCPGPPRANVALSSVAGLLYAIGGMSFVPTPSKSTSTEEMTLVDNWQFDPASGNWKRLEDFPIASSNFRTNGGETSFDDRYIILIGGYQYKTVYYANGSTGPSFGRATRLCPVGTLPSRGIGCLPNCMVQMPNITYMETPPGDWSREYNSDVFVYDTQKGIFGKALGTSHHDPGLIPDNCGAFPINTAMSQVNVLADKLFVIGGECNGRIIPGYMHPQGASYSRDYGHYPPLSLHGRITSLSADARAAQ